MAGQNYGNNILTSIYGRRLGLQRGTTSQFGLTKETELLVGPDALREPNTTDASTGTNLAPYGAHVMDGSSAGSSSVFTLDPPIPGVPVTLQFASTIAAVYLKSANSETFESTLGTSFTVLRSTALAAVTLRLQGLTTATWGVLGLISSGSIVGATST